jgi:iron complex transport system substrate-binding protein
LRSAAALIAWPLAAVIAGACRAPRGGPEIGTQQYGRTVARNPDGCIDRFDPDADYFPDKVRIDSASQVSLEYHGHYKVMTVTFRGFTDNPNWTSVERYVLVQCGTPAPALHGALAAAQLITIPAKTVTVTNNEDLGMMIALGLRDQIKSVGTRAIYDEALWRKLQAGNLIVTFGWGTSEIHMEWMLDLKPDVVVVGAFQSQAALNMNRARAVGLQTVPSLTRVEPTPLGRAEWIKALAAVFNLESRANRLYDDVAAEYRRLARDAHATATRPTAFWASTYASGEWLASRNTFQARLLEDAGAENVLADKGPTVTMRVGPEVILDRAGDADFWITENSDLVRPDGSISVPGTPVEALSAARANHVFHLARRYRTENNSADYYQTAPHRPDLVLADLLAIFHPELASPHEFSFLAPMPPLRRRQTAADAGARR